MAITEQARHNLHKHLEELMGSEDANTLMDHLPPSARFRADVQLLRVGDRAAPGALAQRWLDLITLQHRFPHTRAA